MTVLFDTNVLIDISDHREPFYEKSLEAFTLAVNGVIKGLVSAGAITDIYYIINQEKQAKRGTGIRIGNYDCQYPKSCGYNRS
jgi:predicted nucleic acid-binding protein